MFLTTLQLFALGLGLAASGPCLVTCLPPILAFTTAKQGTFRGKLADTFSFLSGRFLAYVLLGALAGLSAAMLNRFSSGQATAYFRPLAGVISVLLGIMILFKKMGADAGCNRRRGLERGGVFFIGFTLGISPCGPLALLLSEIVLLSKSAWEGAWYGAAFGAGTLVCAFALTAGITGVMHWLPARYPSPVFLRAVRGLSALVLVVFGLLFILR